MRGGVLFQSGVMPPAALVYTARAFTGSSTQLAARLFGMACNGFLRARASHVSTTAREWAMRVVSAHQHRKFRNSFRQVEGMAFTMS